MQADPHYTDVLSEVEAPLLQRAQACIDAGIARERIVLDPGFGFGKTLQHNLDLLAGLPRLARHGYPVLAGLSRKSMLGKLLGRPVEQRLAGSLALATIAVLRGASIVRSHDIAPTCDAVAVAWAAA
jgi:dihydropteroate synthase